MRRTQDAVDALLRRFSRSADVGNGMGTGDGAAIVGSVAGRPSTATGTDAGTADGGRYAAERAARSAAAAAMIRPLRPSDGSTDEVATLSPSTGMTPPSSAISG